MLPPCRLVLLRVPVAGRGDGSSPYSWASMPYPAPAKVNLVAANLRLPPSRVQSSLQRPGRRKGWQGVAHGPHHAAAPTRRYLQSDLIAANLPTAAAFGDARNQRLAALPHRPRHPPSRQPWKKKSKNPFVWSPREPPRMAPSRVFSDGPQLPQARNPRGCGGNDGQNHTWMPEALGNCCLSTGTTAWSRKGGSGKNCRCQRRRLQHFDRGCLPLSSSLPAGSTAGRTGTCIYLINANPSLALSASAWPGVGLSYHGASSGPSTCLCTSSSSLSTWLSTSSSLALVAPGVVVDCLPSGAPYRGSFLSSPITSIASALPGVQVAAGTAAPSSCWPFALLETREVLELFFAILVRPMKQKRNQKMKMTQRRNG